MDRRTALKLIGAVPLASTFGCAAQDLERGAAFVQGLGDAPYEPQFFTEPEWQTVHVLVDLIIPADDRSGSATDARVPDFIDFILNEASEQRRNNIRSGLVWLDEESVSRFEAPFREATDEQRRAILDDVAWPARAPAELNSGVSFFNAMRDLTAAGFFSSRLGYEDLRYVDNTRLRPWTGCSDEALAKLGVSYDLMEHRA